MNSLNDGIQSQGKAPSIKTDADSLAHQLKALNAEIEHFRSFSSSVHQNLLSSPLTVHSGSEVIGTMNREEALAFIERKLQERQRAVEQLELQLKVKAHPEPELPINEEGLLFVDIQEELDDEGNVVNVKLNEKAFKPSSFDLSVRDDRLQDLAGSKESSGSILDLLENVGAASVKSQVIQPVDEAVDEIDLPYIDVREELDEEGNVIGVKFNDEVMWNDRDQMEDHAASEGKIADISRETQLASDTFEEISQDDVCDDVAEQYKDLLDDMEVYKRAPNSKSLKPVDPTELMEKIDCLEISAEDKFRLKGMCVEIHQAKPDHENSVSVATTEHSVPASIERSSNSQVEQQEMIELQILADEFDDDEHLPNDDEMDFDFDMDEDDEEDDDDDSYADHILYGNQGVLGPSIDSRTELLLLNQIMKMREAKLARKEDGANKQEKPAKSVRFAETLQVKEIENVSEDLRQAPPGRISLFKQNRSIGSFKPQTQVEFQQISSSIKETANAQIDAVERPSLETPIRDVMERVVEQADFDQPLSDVMERGSNVNAFTPPVSEVIERVTDAYVSEEYLTNSFENDKSVAERISAPAIPAIKPGMLKADDPIDRSSILEHSILEVEGANQLFTPQPKKLSKFKQRIAENNAQTYRARTPTGPIRASEVVLDISKRESRNDERCEAHEPLMKSSQESQSNTVTADLAKRNSILKFRASRQGKPTALSVPPSAKPNFAEEPVKEATIDYQSLQNDLDTMAKAYLLGMYDDDLGDQGTVVHSIGDFETLNRVVESMSSEATSHEKTHDETVHDHHEEYDEINPQVDEEAESLEEFHDQLHRDRDYNLNDEEEEAEENADDSDDDSPMMRDIVEHSTNDHEDMDSEDYALSSETLNREVSESYYRLRHKLIAKNGGYLQTDAEKEFEPIVPLTASRFKQARLSMGEKK